MSRSELRETPLPMPAQSLTIHSHFEFKELKPEAHRRFHSYARELGALFQWGGPTV